MKIGGGYEDVKVANLDLIYRVACHTDRIPKFWIKYFGRSGAGASRRYASAISSTGSEHSIGFLRDIAAGCHYWACHAMTCDPVLSVG